MQKTCKSSGCQRKFDRTSLSDMCPPCTDAFRVGETQASRRTENSTRQNRARTSGFDTNRDFFASIPPSTSTQSQPPPHSMPNQSTSTNPTQATTPSTLAVNRFRENLQSMEAGAQGGGADPMKDMYTMMLHLCSKSEETEQMKSEISHNTHRLDRLEAKLGDPDEIAVPLSLAIRGLPLPGPGSDDLQLVKAVFREINAMGVDIDRDITKVIRQGAMGENTGTVMVEMKCDDVRASIMKTKKCLESHPNPGMRRIIIKNMKPRLELKVDIALNEMLKKFPGGENFYVAGNGHIREKNHQQRSYQNNFNLLNQPTRHPHPNYQPSRQNPTTSNQQYSRPPPTSYNPVTVPTYSTMSQSSLPSITPYSAPVSVPATAPYMFTSTQYNPQPQTSRPGGPFIFTAPLSQPQSYAGPLLTQSSSQPGTFNPSYGAPLSTIPTVTIPNPLQFPVPHDTPVQQAAQAPQPFNGDQAGHSQASQQPHVSQLGNVGQQTAAAASEE